MKVGEAHPGQVLYAQGRVPKVFTARMSERELLECDAAGFMPAYLMPTWIMDRTTNTREISNVPAPLLYCGPVRIRKAIKGLKTHHIFLYEGQTVGLDGYDFRHLSPIESV